MCFNPAPFARSYTWEGWHPRSGPVLTAVRISLFSRVPAGLGTGLFLPAWALCGGPRITRWLRGFGWLHSLRAFCRPGLNLPNSLTFSLSMGSLNHRLVHMSRKKCTRCKKKLWPLVPDHGIMLHIDELTTKNRRESGEEGLDVWIP